MADSCYQYQPLQEGETTRLLTLLPGERLDPLRGTLEVVSIDFTGSYEALSYVWADPGPPHVAYEILICEGEKDVKLLTLRGGSIFAALRQLRLPDKPRCIWADQCCINQDDLIERSQQVHLMNKLYRNATRVVVWLGMDTANEAADAFSLVHELDAVLQHRDEQVHFEGEAVNRLEQHLQENRRTLKALTDRSWFKRGWIVQEIGTETPATMMWGNAMIDWELLAVVCERLKSYHELRSSSCIQTSDISFLYRRFIEPNESTHHANRFNLVYELQRSRHLQFTDPKDRVFAFLGHFSVFSHHSLSCGPVTLNVDYTKTVKQTYTNVAVQLLQANSSTACILLAAVQHPRRSLPSVCTTGAEAELCLDLWLQEKITLPSWVPDWTWSEGIILAEPICPHDAHGSSTAQLEVLTQADAKPELRIVGVEFDTIVGCSQPLLGNDFYRKKTPDGPPAIVEQLWHELCGEQCFDLTQAYVNGQSAFFALMQTLSNGCVQAAGHDCTLYQEISETLWLQKAARYIVETLGKREIGEDVVEAAKAVGAEQDREKWSRWASSASDGRVFARTDKGYYVLGSSALEPGDVVCVLFGSKVPFCLRPMGSRHLLVGECYVHGLMKGEAIDMLDRGSLDSRVFRIA